MIIFLIPSGLDILCFPSRSTLHSSPPCSVPQDSDICGPHQRPYFLSGFQMGLATGKHWQEIRGWEEREVWGLLPWLLQCGALVASGCLPAGKTTAPDRQFFYSQFFLVLLTALAGCSFISKGLEHSWSLLTPGCFLFGFPWPCPHLWKWSLR